MKKQVNKDHYFNREYLTKERFLNYYYQTSMVINLKPKDVLEIGIGNGLVKEILKRLSIKVVTVDIDKELKPDKIGDIAGLSKVFSKDSFDTVLCAEVLEHIPFNQFENSLKEMYKVTRRYAIISLPYSGPIFSCDIKVPLLKPIWLSVKIPANTTHRFDGQHYWEIGKKGYSLKKISGIINRYFSIIKMFNPHDDSYHIFFVLQKGGEKI